MKKIILFTALALITSITSAQNYREVETPNGKSLIVNHKNGKSSFFNLNDKDAQAELWISGQNSYKEIETQLEPKSYIDEEENHHLTIHFDKSIDMGDFLITSDTITYYSWDMNWSGDMLTGEIDLPENTYEILAVRIVIDWGTLIRTHELVFLSDIYINQDMDTTISFEQMAKNKLSYEFYDENGSLVDPYDPSLINSRRLLNIKLPSPYEIVSYTTELDVYLDYAMISDLNPGHKILLNQFAYKANQINHADLGEISGINSDTMFSNNPSEYKNLKMVMHAPPSSQNNYLCGISGLRNKEFDMWLSLLNIPYNVKNPSFDKDTLQLFLANTEHTDGDNYSMTIVSAVGFWEDPPENSNENSIITAPFFVGSNDSIVFARSNINTASPIYPFDGIVDIGSSIPFFCPSFNNPSSNAIRGKVKSYGQLNEIRDIDLYTCLFEIKKNETLIASGNIYDDFNNQTFNVTETGKYTFAVTNENYINNGVQGCTSLQNEFDLAEADRIPPLLTSFKLIKEDKTVCSSFNFNETGTLLFSAKDNGTPVAVEAYYKKHYDTTWTPLNVVDHPAWYDSFNFGAFYTSSLAEAFSQFTGSGYLDIKIFILDEAGNSTTQTWGPAVLVTNNTQYDNDLALTTVISPVTGNDLGMENVTVRIKNTGTVSQDNFPVLFMLDNGEIVSETVTGTILPGDSTDYTFSEQVNLSEYNITFILKAYTDLDGDENPDNDFQYVEITNNVFPKMVVDPNAIDQSMQPNTISTAPLTISNNGNVTLDFDIKLGAGSLCTELLYKKGCASDGGLIYWELGDVSTNIECSGDPEWYHNFTDMIHYLLPGESYTLNVKAGYRDTNFDLWIDFNDDFQLTDDEIILDDGYIASANTNVSFEITIPSYAAPGKHIMRFRTNEYYLVSDPCETYNYGNCCDFSACIGTDWLSTDVLSGTVETGQSQLVTLTINTNGLEIGTYENTVLITSNDPEHLVVEVPVTLSIITGIDENSSHYFMMYPNPATDEVKLNSDHNINTIKIFSPSGQLLLKKVVNGKQFSINTTGMTPGLYFVEIDSDYGRVTQKLIVK